MSGVPKREVAPATTADVSGVTTTFTSDGMNRLTGAVTGPEVTTYTNDLYGQRTACALSEYPVFRSPPVRVQ
jgi:hypothetical protein